jgi:hypothetical protein
VLHAAGAPVGVRALGLTPGHLKEAIVAASEIRSRFTVLDFAVDLGVFDIIQESVLEASGCLGV